MAILTHSGRTALAIALKAQPLFLAWGAGDEDWDEIDWQNPEEVPPLPVDATDLLDTVGYRRATDVRFVVPDEDGAIIVPNGRFSLSEVPTRYVYTRFNFDFEDSPQATIREAGVFVGTEAIEGLPPGQAYFLPAQIADPGTLLMLERFPRIIRSNAVRQSFEFVLTL